MLIRVSVAETYQFEMLIFDISLVNMLKLKKLADYFCTCVNFMQILNMFKS